MFDLFLFFPIVRLLESIQPFVAHGQKGYCCDIWAKYPRTQCYLLQGEGAGVCEFVRNPKGKPSKEFYCLMPYHFYNFLGKNTETPTSKPWDLNNSSSYGSSHPDSGPTARITWGTSPGFIPAVEEVISHHKYQDDQCYLIFICIHLNTTLILWIYIVMSEYTCTISSIQIPATPKVEG